MQHLDEGTIHAWLDGELPFDESSRVAAHAEACEKCTAMIAEARGFVAAASRILRSLDDVPGDVIPGASASATSGNAAFSPRDWGIVLPIPRRHEVRRWIPSRFAAAAALAVVAVGTYTVLNRSDRSAMSEIRIPAVVEAVPEAAAELVDSSAFSSGAVRGLKDAPNRQQPTAAAGAAPSESTVAAQSPAAGRADRAGADAAANSARARDVITAPPPAAALPPSPGARDARTQQLAAKAATPARSTVASAAAKANADSIVRDSARAVVREESLAAVAQAAEKKRLTVSPDSAIEAERRRLVGENQARLRLPAVVTTGTAVTNERQRLAGNLTITTAVGCYDLRRGEAAMAAGVPSGVRLANVPVRVGSRTLRLAVPDDATEASANERWYWSLGSGAIVLHKVVGGVVGYEAAVVAVRRAC